MTKRLPLCFEVYRRIDLNESPEERDYVLAYEILLYYLTQECEQFLFSLRHLYNPLDSKKLRSFILINSVSPMNVPNIIDTVEGLFKGILSRFYNLTYKPEGFPKLNWVNSIGEIIKCGEFVEEPEFAGYLPHLFSTQLTTSNLNLLELLEGTRCERLILEFSLEAYNSPSEKACWSNAIEDLVDRLSNFDFMSNSVRYALELYRNYQYNYANNQLFNYSIKALSQNTADTFASLQTVIGIVSNKNIRQKINPILTLRADDANFTKSLEATKNVQIYKGIKWKGWEKTTGKILEQKLIKETVKSGGFLSSLDDGSLTFPILPSNLSQFNQSQPINQGGSSSLSRIFDVQIPQVEHLKPLHHITTYQEVIGFFQVFSPGVPSDKSNFLNLSAEAIFTKYRNLITKDTYIVGLDDNEEPIVSSWAEIPHRLIAGVSGSGKSNFLNWIIFQFLYVNPERKVYIADFGGLDFQHLNRIQLNVEMVDAAEDCAELVKKIHHEEYERRLALMQEHSVSDLKLLQKEGVNIDRTLWIIDEAADIADVSSKLRNSIEIKLKEYARKGRKYGIHVLYCTQRPTTEVITKQVTDQCEEKTVFRVTPEASQRILDDTVAGDIPKNARGRAWLDGYAGRMFVNVPKMKKLEGSTIPLEDTLWRYFISK